MELEGGYKAEISFAPAIKMFQGEFLDLENGGADFYAKDVAGVDGRRHGVP